jgi:hypothetical protein
VSFAQYLPLAFVMVAGPQILSSIFLATSKQWKANSFLFCFGAFISITLVLTAGYLISSGASNQGASDKTLDIIILVLLVLAVIHVFLTRKTAEPPKWMGELENANPKFSFRLGFLLLGVFPTDILTSFAVGGYLSSHDKPWTDGLGFVLLTVLLLALPALALLTFGERAEKALPKVRKWMNDNSWLVNELVLALFIALTASSAFG